MSSIELNRRLGAVAAEAPARRASATPWQMGRGVGKYIVAAEIIADLFAAAIAVVATSAICMRAGWETRLPSPMVAAAIACSCAAVLVFMLYRSGAYHASTSLLRIKETELVLRASVQSTLLGLAVFYAGARLVCAPTVIASAFVTIAFVLLEKHILLTTLGRLHARGHGLRKVVIYGAGFTGRRLFSALVQSAKLGLRPVAIIDDDASLAGERVFELFYRRSRSCHIMPGPITRDGLVASGADLLVVAIPTLPHDRLAQLEREARAAGTDIAFVAADASTAASPSRAVKYGYIDGLLLASPTTAPLTNYYNVTKRMMDIVFSAVLLIALWPVFMMIALAIRMDSRGPIFFRQVRIGKAGVPFEIYKFRTMRADARPYAFSPKHPCDSRITRVGRILRRTSLDELPQLWNVLTGEMSLVGPRPEMPFIASQYSEREQHRLQVTPGITGLWQISGDRSFLIHENLHYDLYYISNRSFFMDIAILLHTVVFAMRGT